MNVAHYRVDVECTDSSHEGRVVRVDSYIGSRRGQDAGSWVRMPPERRDGKRPARSTPDAVPDEAREDMHENLVCKLCPRGGAKVSAREPVLWAAFDAIADAVATPGDGWDGVASVELRTLAAIVSKQQASRSA